MSQIFLSDWASPVLAEILRLFLRRRTHFVTGTALNYYAKYVNIAAKSHTTRDAVAQVAPTVIGELALPITRRVPADEVLWNDDPIEFIRKENDLCRAYYS